jgi:hypothetical protein
VVAESAVALFSGLIDYAGLFPPASLGMAAAVANYDAYLSAEYSWMLGRFIVPVARLEEFEKALVELPAVGLDSSSSSFWQLSVLAGADVSADVARIREFNDQFTVDDAAREVRIESIELKIASVAEIEQVSAIIPAAIEAYCGGGWLRAARQDSDGWRDGGQISCGGERGGVHAGVRRTGHGF